MRGMQVKGVRSQGCVRRGSRTARGGGRQIRVGLAGGGEEHGVDVGEQQFRRRARPGSGRAVGSGQRSEPDEVELPFRADPVDVRDVQLVLEGPHRYERIRRTNWKGCICAVGTSSRSVPARAWARTFSGNSTS